MTAGLLVCDHVNPEYQPKFGDYPDMFVQLFPEFNWKFYNVVGGSFPTSINECDVYFSTGSRYSVYENLDWIAQLKKLVQEIYRQDLYFIGFCFGHQIIGEALGGKVEKSPNGWCVGVHKFKILKEKSWMQPEQNSMNLLMMCQDQISELPKNTIRLAGNNNCPNGIIQIGEKFLGIQAHPEYSREYDQLLMELRGDRIGEKLVKKGVASLEKDVNQESIRQWIFNFLGQKFKE